MVRPTSTIDIQLAGKEKKREKKKKKEKKILDKEKPGFL